jgi:hypothetical protein
LSPQKFFCYSIETARDCKAAFALFKKHIICGLANDSMFSCIELRIFSHRII